ncbi:efflux RND transporter permease subunit [Paludibaculum fermentans]|uniref:efflux RND transporter permease subunit n=1 Tax=Paludibaculum fermentans TaxID=1473598 RepID=UPI003EBDE664
MTHGHISANDASGLNPSRFSVEHPHITWVLLIGTLLWGIYGYRNMPQRKDPDIPVKMALVETHWPGASAERVEELVTKNIEKVLASNSKISKIESTSRSNISIITFSVSDEIKDASQVLDDIAGRLAAIRDLPEGAGPIRYQRDFGDTATLMLTVASPRMSSTDIDVRSAQVHDAITAIRPTGKQRATMVFCFPPRDDFRLPRLGAVKLVNWLAAADPTLDPRLLDGASCVGADVEASRTDAQLMQLLSSFLHEFFPQSRREPGLWQPFLVRDLAELRHNLAAVVGDKYSYRELDDYTDAMEKALMATGRNDVNAPLVAKVTRSGVLAEQVQVVYSQERLASYSLKPASLSNVLQARNLTSGGGELDTGNKSISLHPSGEFKSEREIKDVIVGATSTGAPLYLRDVADVVRTYENPPRFLNYYSWRDPQGQWQRTRAVTLSIQMGAGQQIKDFGEQVDATLASLKQRLPQDLIVARTSDQPLQVEEKIDLFMASLYEAIALVVLVSLIGFWEWRSALLMALSIPLTLLLTFGMMKLLGLDLQQISIASLIIALGLLVDDPVVAGDAIKRELAAGSPRGIAAWLGPTKLATAILYATITNIVAYVPFLILPGTNGQFVYSLPVVMTCSLVASRLVSWTFIPLLGGYLLRATGESTLDQRKSHGFGAAYYRVGHWAISHRWLVLAGAGGILLFGGAIGRSLKPQFFPKDLSQLAFIDVMLPEDASFTATSETLAQVEKITEEVSAARRMPIEAMSSFVGAGAPRFWYSLSPEAPHTNYAQIVLVFKDKHDTHHLLPYIQERVSREIAGARIDARELETGDSVGLPVAIRVSGLENTTLRSIAQRVAGAIHNTPSATRVRDNWGEDRFNVELKIDPDRANLAGLTNRDIAGASATAVSGTSLTYLRDGDKQIPVVARMRADEFAGLGDLNSLYAYSNSGRQRVPIRQVAKLDYSFNSEVIRHINQVRAITVSAWPVEGMLASDVMKQLRPELDSISRSLPPGYKIEIGGEEEKQVDGFKNLSVVLVISVVAIFLALTFQFKNAIKPFIVFAAVPFGAVGAMTALWILDTPFGFMAFLGVISLVGVIVSHIIVLFDFIEEKHEEGEPFEQAVLDAGIVRLRPVLITVGATVFGLVPLAMHGGPLWEPLCYAQIGGLTAATFITLLLVPVFYSICVLDLKIVKWERVAADSGPAQPEPAEPAAAGQPARQVLETRSVV